MDVAFEKRDWTIEHGQTVAAPERARSDDLARADWVHPDWPHPDWQILRARMRAVRQVWQIIRDTHGTGRRSGSFDRGSAWQLSALKTESAGVNQKASANGKRGQDTYDVVAGLSSTGARGLK